MSRMSSGCFDADPSSRSIVADVLVREQPDAEEDEEDDGDEEDDDKDKEDDDKDKEDEGYSE
jgi:hypothetical protein